MPYHSSKWLTSEHDRYQSALRYSPSIRNDRYPPLTLNSTMTNSQSHSNHRTLPGCDSFYRRIPTAEALAQYQKYNGDQPYWLTEDFFCNEESLEPTLGILFSELIEIEDGERGVEFKIGRRIIQEARKLNIPPKILSYQLNNFTQTVLTPICIWHWDGQGDGNRYTLQSNLRKPSSPDEVYREPQS